MSGIKAAFANVPELLKGPDPDEKLPIETALKGKKLIGLYFGAKWYIFFLYSMYFFKININFIFFARNIIIVRNSKSCQCITN